MYWLDAVSNSAEACTLPTPNPITNPWLVLLTKAPLIAGPLIVGAPPVKVGNDGEGYNTPPEYGVPPVFTSPTATTCAQVRPGTLANVGLLVKALTFADIAVQVN